MAYVFVVHLAPDHDSALSEIISKVTTIPVHEITDNISLAPNNIYVIPENNVLTVVDGVLKLTPRDLKVKVNLPINVFFKSLAEMHGSFAIGVILTGTGFDGTDGIKSIKEFGGVTYAQDLNNAAFEGMPLIAINSGAVDFIMPVNEIPEHLQHIMQAYKKTKLKFLLSVSIRTGLSQFLQAGAMLMILLELMSYDGHS